jgi:hypothetical protein
MEQPTFDRDETIRSELYQAAQRKDFPAVENLVDGIASSPDKVKTVLDPHAWAKTVNIQRGQPQAEEKHRNVILPIVVVFGGLLLIAVIGYFLYQVNPDLFSFLPLKGEPLATEIPAQIVVVTATPTIGPSSTPLAVIQVVCPTEPAPTPTPKVEIPASQQKIYPAYPVYPEIPTLAEAAWIIDDTQALLNPAVSPDNNIWTGANSADPGLAKEAYLYTIQGGVNITYTLDTPLPGDGIYQILALDTNQNSNITQAYTILIDDQVSLPYRGTGTVRFAPDAKVDQWQSLGFYQGLAGQKLSVIAQVPILGEGQSFALDRLLILKVAREIEPMLEALPAQQPLASLVDDRLATSEILVSNKYVPYSKFLGEVNDAIAWNMGFKTSTEIPMNDVRITWPVGRLPAGDYKLLVWVPSEHATAKVIYQLFIDGEEILTDREAELILNDFGDAWVDVGLWSLDREGDVEVVLLVPKDTQGEVGVDAVAIVGREPHP